MPPMRGSNSCRSAGPRNNTAHSAPSRALPRRGQLGRRTRIVVVVSTSPSPRRRRAPAVLVRSGRLCVASGGFHRRPIGEPPSRRGAAASAAVCYLIAGTVFPSPSKPLAALHVRDSSYPSVAEPRRAGAGDWCGPWRPRVRAAGRRDRPVSPAGGWCRDHRGGHRAPSSTAVWRLTLPPTSVAKMGRGHARASGALPDKAWM